LGITVGRYGDKIVMNCLAGCRTRDVLGALGLGWRDLFGKADGMSYQRREKKWDQLTATQVYESLLNVLTLGEPERVDLLARGMTEDTIRLGGYRTLRGVDLRETHRIPESVLTSVPGFSMNCEMVKTSGLVFPILGVNGDVKALQVRTGADGRKYETFSGGPAGSIGSPCHCPIRAVPAIVAGDVFLLTEGHIKAELATQYGYPAVGLIGITAFGPSLDLVRRFHPKTVVLAFDMDRQIKEGVALAQERAAEALASLGVEVEIASWDPTAHNGIDDALVGGLEIDIKPWEGMKKWRARNTKKRETELSGGLSRS
jgi:hypothetical protein